MMKIVHLPLYLSPEEAHSLIDFLDQIRSLLTSHYAPEIQRHHQKQGADYAQDSACPDDSDEPPF